MGTVLLTASLLLSTACLELSAQSFVQISSVRARPTTLNCVGPGATAKVRVQIYAAGLDPSIQAPMVGVSLAVYSAHPSRSTLSVGSPEQRVELGASPAIADFDVACTSETLPGTVSLAATISSAPPGFSIHEPLRPAIVRFTIAPAQ